MKNTFVQRLIYGLVLSVGIWFGMTVPVDAAKSSNPEQSGTTGIQGTISSPAPTKAATITVPTTGRSFTTTPITVSGLCTTGLLVKMFSNNVFVGAVQCESGSYSIQVDLFSGENVLVARVYDALDQAGPDSNSVSVTFQNADIAPFGQRVSLTSNFAKIGAPIGTQLTWPIILSGGSAPYAVSVDWGDNTAYDLKSLSFVGSFDITHVYKTAGVYRVVVKATDKNGAVAFLQLVGVGSGAVTQKSSSSNTSNGGSTASQQEYVWWPTLLITPFAFAAFWIGRRFEVVAIHRRLEKQASIYQNELQN